MRKYTINEQFFDEYNEESCYFLGWLLTDGHIQFKPQEKYSIRFELGELEPIEVLRDLIGANNPIITSDRKVNPLYLLVLNNKNIINSLIQLGIPMGHKHDRLTVPDNLPRCMMKHFIRGVFEGDGCVTIRKPKGNKKAGISSYICSTSKVFLEQIGTFLKEEIELIPKIYEEKPGFFRLRYGGQESYALYDYLYKDAKYILSRKKNVFEEGLRNHIASGKSICKRCKKEFVKVGRAQQWCSECQPIIKREQWKQSGIRKRQKRNALND